jgi:hypothetical protein
MTIHHSQRAQAERMGFTLEERGKFVVAFHASTAVQIFGVSGKDAITQMTAYLNIHAKDHEVRFTFDRNDERVGYLRRLDDKKRSAENGTPVELFRHWGDRSLHWVEQVNSVGGYYAPDGTLMNSDGTRSVFDDIDSGGDPEPDAPAFEEDGDPKPEVDPTPPIARNTAGVPLDGAIAYAEGIMAADNPFEEGTEEADSWDSQWDQAADESPDAEDSDKGGSVVASKYRTKYAEMGHPTHCGDWLAELLNNYCIGDKNTDLETFERICALNGVDTSKYRRAGVGWQGRIRMTGRNLLAKRVFASGKIVVPQVGGEEGAEYHELKAPADWIATRKYTKPAQAA